MDFRRKITKALFSFSELARTHVPGEAGYRVVISPYKDWQPPILRFTRYTRHQITFAPLSQTDLSAFDLAVPLNIADVFYLADRPHLTQGHALVHPSRRSVELLHDKGHFDSFVRSVGRGHLLPPTIHSPQAGTPYNPSAHHFPFILKPRIGEFSHDCHLIRTPAELEPHRHLLSQDSHIAQHYVPGNSEYAVHLYVRNRRIVCSVGIEYIFGVENPIKGTHSPITQGLYRCPFLHEWLDILNAAGFQGICCVNYKLTPDGRPMLFEINPRFGGSLAPLFFTFLRHLQPRRHVLQSRVAENVGAHSERGQTASSASPAGDLRVSA